MEWNPPRKNCGMCGAKTCAVFLELVKKGEKSYSDCVFYGKGRKEEVPENGAVYSGADMLERKYDFVLEPLPGEVSVRKIILLFRADLVEKWNIKKGGIVVGRPAGSGCPVQHVLKVIDANPVTGVLTCWVVGPKYSRGKRYWDVEAYHVAGFEGVARVVDKEPVFGLRQRFLPGYCMMNMSHTGVVNMVLNKEYGIHVRIEDVRL